MNESFLIFCIIYASVASNNLFPHFSEHNSRIINGEDAIKGQFPFQVEILNLKERDRVMCSGAIISEIWILTAAHCVDGAGLLVIYSGGVTMGSFDMDSTRGIDYIVHEDYNSTTLENDIGLVLLYFPFTFDDFTQPIALGETEVKSGINATITGWGYSKHNNSDYVTNPLQYAVVKTLDNSDCQKIYGKFVTEKILCAIGENPVKNPCFSDGGAPLVTGPDFVHVGIFSFLSNQGCEEEGYPAGYIRTAYFRDWIREKTGV